MEDLSLHILDIAENATRAGATLIEIEVLEDEKRDLLEISIRDNGRGMDPEMLERATDPFSTTRTTRRVGLGLSLLQQAANEAGGDLILKSEPGRGTRVAATFQKSHIDRKPIGDLGSTLTALIMGNPRLDFVYFSNLGGEETEVDTRVIRDQLGGGVSIDDPAVINLIKDLFKNSPQN
jgi:anti-sigma regulatory factor (Ser/Thr protein kinase)